jgi:HK97 family phage major capsid protein
MDSAEFQAKLLAGTEALTAKVKLLETALAASGSEGIAAKTAITEIEKAMADIRKSQIALKSQAGSVKRNGEISRDAALFLGGIGCLAALKAADGLGYTQAQRDFLSGKAADIFGIEAKAALTTSDIPMPTQFMGDVVELVYEYGVARQLATVFPMGNASIKLPKLGTDSTFGLLAASGTVAEKSPTVTFVTMTAEKFGGMVRLPSEIDEDSVVAMGQFLARYGARQLAYVEDYQVFRSTGAGSGLNGTGKGLTKLCVDNSIVINQDQAE